MLDLRSLDPVRQSADRPVALLGAYVLLGTAVAGAVLAGAGFATIWTGASLALAGLPWLLAFRGRARLEEDARARVPFAWRGERVGVWVTAPPGGGFAAVAVAGALGLESTPLLVVLALAAAAAYTWLLVWAERRYERTIFG